MKVSEIMHSYVECCQPDAHIADVAQKMVNQDCGLIPVVEGRKAVGVITDRDITTRVVAARRNPADIRARDVMSTRLVCINKEAQLEDCCGVMGEHRFRRLLVVEKDGSLAGVISVADIVKHSDPKEAGHLIKLISESEQAIVAL